jgi:hypothetical protein
MRKVTTDSEMILASSTTTIEILLPTNHCGFTTNSPNISAFNLSFVSEDEREHFK